MRIATTDLRWKTARESLSPRLAMSMLSNAREALADLEPLYDAAKEGSLPVDAREVRSALNLAVHQLNSLSDMILAGVRRGYR